MERWTITCESCERMWTVECSFTFYEQQALESRPCPHCGAYTLACSPCRELVTVGLDAARRWSSVAL